MDLHPQLKTNIQKWGFLSPTEIQDKTFQKLGLRERTFIGIANTGTGKQALFWALSERLLKNDQQGFNIDHCSKWNLLCKLQEFKNYQKD